MKVAIIGGGGARIPAVIHALAAHHPKLPIREVAFYDTNRHRLRLVEHLSRSILADCRQPFAVSFAEEPAEAIAGSAFVIVSVRPGGQAARAIDERIALNYGCIGQETTGAAGFSFALRTIPVVQEYAELTARLAPRAWLINFTNPAGLVTQALHDRTPVPILGVCDSPHAIGRRIAEVTGLPESELNWTYAGLNHLGWVTSVHHRGRPLLPDLIADKQALAALLKDELLPPDLVRQLAALPNEYCYFYYCRDLALASQLASPETRGELLARLEKQLEDTLASLDPDDCGSWLEAYGHYLREREATYLATERRGRRQLATQTTKDLILAGGEGYIGVAIKVMSALAGHAHERLVLNVANMGIIRGLEDDDIVEVMCEVTADGITPIPGPPLRPETLALIRLVKAYERLTSEAALQGSRVLAVRALTHHPLVNSYPLATQLVDAYLRAHKEYLPRFSQERFA